MKSRVHVIKFPVYDYTVRVIVCADILKERKKYNAQIGGEIKDFDGALDALHSYNEDEPESYLFFNPTASINLIAHECYHCVCRIFRWIEAAHEEEVFAYHLGYLVEAVKRFL